MNAEIAITGSMTSTRMPRACVADWDRSEVFDAVRDVIARDDAYDLCLHTDRVMRVCNEIENLDLELCALRDEMASAHRVIVDQQAEMRDLRSQIAAEREEAQRLRNEANQMRDTIAKLESRRVAVALELLTLAVTGMSSFEITARLNEQVRSQRCADFDLSDVGDAAVIDLEASS